MVAAVAAGVAVLGVLLVGGCFYWCYRRRKRRRRERAKASMESSSSSKDTERKSNPVKDIEMGQQWMSTSADDARWLIEWNDLVFDKGEESCIIGHGANG